MSQKASSERLPSFLLESSERLWEWHIPTDRLFLSRGARAALGMEPATMGEFLSHTPEGCLQSLCELREGVIAGEKSFLETAYPVESLFVRERLFVLERDETGRAIRLFGQYEISSGTLSYIPPVSTTTKGQIGFWVCSLEERTVRFDGKSSLLLGYPEAVSHIIGLDEWKKRLQH